MRHLIPLTLMGLLLVPDWATAFGRRRTAKPCPPPAATPSYVVVPSYPAPVACCDPQPPVCCTTPGVIIPAPAAEPIPPANPPKVNEEPAKPEPAKPEPPKVNPKPAEPPPAEKPKPPVIEAPKLEPAKPEPAKPEVVPAPKPVAPGIPELPTPKPAIEAPKLPDPKVEAPKPEPKPVVPVIPPLVPAGDKEKPKLDPPLIPVTPEPKGKDAVPAPAIPAPAIPEPAKPTKEPETPKIPPLIPKVPTSETEPSVPPLKIPPPVVEPGKSTSKSSPLSNRPQPLVEIIPVDGEAPTNGEQTRSVGFINQTDREMVLTVHGEQIRLPKHHSIRAEVPTSFRWKIDEGEEQTVTIPSTAPGVEVIIRR